MNTRTAVITAAKMSDRIKSLFLFPIISHLLRQLFAEHSVGLEQQHQDQQSKGKGIAEDGDDIVGLDHLFIILASRHRY